MASDDIFADELEKAAEEIQSQESQEVVRDVPEEYQDQLDNLESLASIDPSVRDMDEYKDLMTKIEGSPQATDDEEESEEEEEEEESEEEESEEEEEEVEEDVEDVFGVLTKTKKAKKVEVNFDIPEGMEELLSSRYGIEDAGTFFGSVDTWRTQAQEGAESKSDLEALSADIQNLPPDIRKTISLWADGEDYTAPFTQGERLNFGDNFLEQDIDSLVQHYLPDEYDAVVNEYEKEGSEMTDDEYDSKLELLARTTKNQFNAEKKALGDERAQYDSEQDAIMAKMKTTALGSVENLSKSYPNFSKSELAKVRNVLVEGKVDSLFYNSDGSYTAEAAEMVANAMYGGKMRESLVKKAERQGVSKANQKIVDSSPKSMRKNKSSQGKGGLNTKAVDHLSGAFETDPYA